MLPPAPEPAGGAPHPPDGLRYPPYETRTFPWALTATFFVLSLIKILRHEMWRDELQAWLIAKNSSSLADLLHNIRYEGHPPLWYVLLYGISGLTDRPEAMQLLHLAIATALVFVVTRYAPFTRLQKLLFAFGYFPAFEYAVISRIYAPGILLTFLFCALFASPRRPYLALSVILLLLAQTSAHGIIMAIALALACTLDTAIAAREGRARDLPRGSLAAGALLFLVGLAGTLISLAPAADAGTAVGWITTLDLHRLAMLLATFWRAYVPIPEITYHFWSTNILGTSPDALERQALLFLPVLALSLFSLARKPAALCLWLFGSAGFLAFWYMKYPGSLRHHGHLFILFLAAYWIAGSCRAWEIRPAGWRHLIAGWDPYRPRFLSGLLAVHVLAGTFASGMDLVLPFSASPATARFIQQHYPRDVPIVADWDSVAVAVAGHLDRGLYYPRSRRTGTFLVQDNRRRLLLPQKALMAEVEAVMAGARRDVLLVLSYELDPPVDGVELVERFDRSIVESETYSLYLARYGRCCPRGGQGITSGQ